MRSSLLALPLLKTATVAANLPQILDHGAWLGRSNTTGKAPPADWPYGPFSTRGRDIVNARGEPIVWAGVNWPMSGETMIPEGLEWASYESILDQVASVGFNFLRMGYAIQMVNEMYDRGGEDVPLELAMVTALGYVNGTKVTSAIVRHNPGWSRTTTRFEIWSDVVRAAARRGIFVHPDVHMQKAAWCCSHTDGNGWFGDVHFSAANWTRGLGHVAAWARAHPNVVSVSLLNEPRESWNVSGWAELEYGWGTFVGNMTRAADAVHAANPDLLISWSGLQYGEDLSALTAGANLLTAPCYKCTAVRDAGRRRPVVFDLARHPWADKVFWELHLYSMSEDVDTGTCAAVRAALYRAGLNALGADEPPDCARLAGGECRPAARLTPVAVTEFGHAQDESLFGDVLQTCLRDLTTELGVSWAVWALAGSYRIRSGAQGVGDSWALGNYDWTGWGFPEGIERWWRPWVEAMNATRAW